MKDKNTTIKETERYILFYQEGFTSFSGCQCYKDCLCMESFKSEFYRVYGVRKKTGKIKTTYHKSLVEADKRIEVLVGQDDISKIYL